MRVPRAVLIQGTTNGDDEDLVLVARQGSPNRRWWWGVRRWWRYNGALPGMGGYYPERHDDDMHAQTGAWCYLCNQPIATWSSRWPMTVSAKLAIQRHRTEHIQGRLDTPAPETQT